MRGLFWLFRKVLGSLGRDVKAGEDGVFELPSWYVDLKLLMSAALGGLLIYFSLAGSISTRTFDRVCMFVIGSVVVAPALSVTERVRSVQVAHGVVIVDFAGGRRSTWDARDLIAEPPAGVLSGALAVRLRRTGRTVFVIPRDRPSRDVLAASLEVEASS